MAYLNAAAGAARESAGSTETSAMLAAIPVAAVVSLTAASGTADGTVDDVTASHSQTILNNNFQEMATKINAVLAALRTAKIVTP